MSTKANIDSLTGLRGIAAMMVVCNHYYVWSATYPVASAPKWLTPIFATSNYGMTLFFTLSGFVITYNYYDFGWERSPLRSFGSFAFRRFSRLYPALLIFLGALAVAKFAPAYSDGRVGSLLKWTALHVASVETWLPFKWNGAMPIDNIFHVSWSISTEFMMYFMFAGFIILAFQASRWGPWGRVAVALVMTGYVLFVLVVMCSYSAFEAFAAAWYVPVEPLTQADTRRWFFYMSPYFRVLQFGMGCLVGWLILFRRELLEEHRDRLRRAALLAVIALVALHFRGYIFHFTAEPLAPVTNFFARLGSPQWSVPAFDLLTALLFSIVMLNGADSSRINRFLAAPALLFLGEISYSLYLFHPLSPRFGLPQTREFFYWLMPAHAFNFVSFLFFAIIFAYGMYSLVEMPAQRWLRRLVRRKGTSQRESVAAAP